jgi:hypothetical protein
MGTVMGEEEVRGFLRELGTIVDPLKHKPLADWSDADLGEVNRALRRWQLNNHPDKGGSVDMCASMNARMDRLREAIEAAQKAAEDLAYEKRLELKEEERRREEARKAEERRKKEDERLAQEEAARRAEEVIALEHAVGMCPAARFSEGNALTFTALLRRSGASGERAPSGGGTQPSGRGACTEVEGARGWAPESVFRSAVASWRRRHSSELPRHHSRVSGDSGRACRSEGATS